MTRSEQELRALVARDSSTLPALEAPNYEPESPSDNLNVYEKGAWERQNEVLRAYSLCRTKSVAARVTGVGRTTIFEWIKTDYLGFKDRLAAADEAFLGDLENLASYGSGFTGALQVDVIFPHDFLTVPVINMWQIRRCNGRSIVASRQTVCYRGLINTLLRRWSKCQSLAVLLEQKRTGDCRTNRRSLRIGRRNANAPLQRR